MVREQRTLLFDDDLEYICSTKENSLSSRMDSRAFATNFRPMQIVIFLLHSQQPTTFL